MPAVVLGIAAAATVYSAVKQNQAAKDAAAVDNATAAYNAKIDRAQEAQLDLDTRQNIKTERQDEAMYLSHEAASYAASGVLATTGSPMHVQVATAGRMEQKIQQQWVDAQQRQQALESAAKAGIALGSAQASADRARGTIALIDGGAKLAGMAFGAYQSGLIGGSTPSPSASFYGADTGAGSPNVTGLA